jgi:hypothetical protein
MRATRPVLRPGHSAAFLVGIAFLVSAVTPAIDTQAAQPTKMPPGSATPLGSGTPTPSISGTPAPAKTQTSTTPQATPSLGPIGDEPYPSAPLCPDSGDAHNNSRFHTLWDSERHCHYDHEHGQDPFTDDVEAAFPGMDLPALLGSVEVGHTNPSSPMENTHKHGGFKWNVQLTHPQGCRGFEGSANGVNGSVIQYHNFGDYSVELESAVHSTTALLRQCNQGNPTDYGYVYTVQFQNYGQIVVPYQGTIFPYPYYSVPAYASARGPYLSVNCIGPVPQCRGNLGTARRNVSASVWTSKPTGRGARPESSTLFRLQFRVADAYQNFDWSDQTHPFTFDWLCSSDGGQTFDPAGCRYNNSTTQVHEIGGEIPASWDNLPGFDTDPLPGRITAEGYTTRFGQLNPACTAPGADCHPIRLVRAFVGTYGSVLVFTPGKGANLVPYLPERDVYFCNGRECREGDPGAVPSGWIGTHN